jgi:anti-anti-sigma factor
MPGSVEITTRHLRQAVVCQLRGELDLAATAGVRDRLLSAVGDLRPATAVVLDLDGLTILSPAAVPVLLDVAERCRSNGVQVSAVIGADHPTRRAAALLDAVPTFETIVSALERAARDESAATEESAGAAEKGEQFTSLTHSLLAARSVGEVLTRVVRAAAVMVPTADLASITLRDHSGVLHTPVRSDVLADRLDALQYQFRQGPCYDSALPSGPGSVACADLAAATTPWPKFAPLAVELGMAAVLSVALITGADSRDATGSLNVYSRTVHGLDGLDHDVMLLLATHASLAVSHTRAVDYAALRETQLLRAMDTRDVIGQAKGIIMARRGVDAEDAFEILRHASQDLNIRLVELAETLTSRHHELDT